MQVSLVLFGSLNYVDCYDHDWFVFSLVDWPDTTLNCPAAGLHLGCRDTETGHTGDGDNVDHNSVQDVITRGDAGSCYV